MRCMRRRTERGEACCSVFSRVSGPCVKAATVVVCSSGCVVVVYSVGAREMGLVGVGAVLQFVLTLRTGPYRSVPLAAGQASTPPCPSSATCLFAKRSHRPVYMKCDCDNANATAGRAQRRRAMKWRGGDERAVRRAWTCLSAVVRSGAEVRLRQLPRKRGRSCRFSWHGR